MGILTNEEIAPTLQEKQDRIAQRVRKSAANIFSQLVQAQTQGIEMLWNNPQGLTPQEVCDALGVDASKVFLLHSMLTQTIIDIAAVESVAADIGAPTNAFTINADGTVTVLDTPYGV